MKRVFLISSFALAVLLSAAACNASDRSLEELDRPHDGGEVMDSGHEGDQDLGLPGDTGDPGHDPDTDEEVGEDPGLSPEEFAARCDAVGELPDGTLPALDESHPPHGEGDEARLEEHMGLMRLVAYDEATHVSINDGYWCNPTTWHNGEVPGSDARVVIHPDHTVIYDIVSEDSLFTVRVDGTLNISSQVSSTMVFDTLVVDQRGTLNIGSRQHPVGSEVEVNLVVADNGDIDTSWDPTLVSRGLISHGKARLFGQEKSVHLKVSEDPSAGDTELVLAEAPHNWRVGDTLVLAGTRYSGWKWNHDASATTYFGTQDEVRTIVAIEGARVTIDSPLEYDHHAPRADLKTSVANFTRNITVKNENADVATHRRGHVMFMHSRDIEVRYASFWQLGRTDKSQEARAVETLSDVNPDSNIQGRYSFHLHRTGTNDQRNLAISIGNAVFGSPGWGYVQHDSHAAFENNASFDTFGAGFVAETGNETGVWSNNIAIKAQGNSAINPKNGVDIDIFDIARTGSGFWFQGRMVRAYNNVAASVNQGFAYFHRGGGMIRFDAKMFALPEAHDLDPSVNGDDPPILSFHDNEAFASTVGLAVVKANTDQNHDVRSWMANFTAWEVRFGANLEYTAHYTLENFDVVGMTAERFREPHTGISLGNNTADMTILNPRVEGFETGIELGKHFTSNIGPPGGVPPEANGYVVINPTLVDVENEYAELDLSIDVILSTEELVEGRFEIHIDGMDSLTFREGLDEGGRITRFSGEKTDAIGSISLPAGIDHLNINSQGMRRYLEQKGYYLDSEETPYVIVEEYFTDRVTNETRKVGIPVRLDENVPLHNEYFSYADAVQIGPIDFDNQPPNASDDDVSTGVETDVTFDVLANDTDPEGDALEVSGVFSAKYGMVFENEDGTLTYRPDFGFSGTDSFRYWAHDKQGNFSHGDVVVNVQ